MTPSHAPASIPAPIDPSVAVAALLHDTGLPTYVVDATGRIHFGNDAAAHLLNGGNPLVGRALAEFHPDAFVRERLGLVQEALTRNEPVQVEGLQRGRFVRSTFRPLPTNGDPTPKVLVVTRPASGPAGPGVRRASADDSGKLGELTRRELDVLELIAQGLSTADIAKRLGRSVKTVEWHRVSLGEKLGAKNRVELARLALAAGLGVGETAKAAPQA